MDTRNTRWILRSCRLLLTVLGAAGVTLLLSVGGLKPAFGQTPPQKAPDATTQVAGDTNAKAEHKDDAIAGDPAKGKVVFEQDCVACHGIKGDGKGPAAAALNPKPADFTDKKFMAKLSTKTLYTAIEDGGAAVGKSGAMPAWKGVLTDQQMHDVTAYLTTLCK